MIDTTTALGKVDTLNTATSNIAATSLLPKPLDIASSYPIIDSPVDSLDTYMEDNNSIIIKPLNIL